MAFTQVQRADKPKTQVDKKFPSICAFLQKDRYFLRKFAITCDKKPDPKDAILSSEWCSQRSRAGRSYIFLYEKNIFGHEVRIIPLVLQIKIFLKKLLICSTNLSFGFISPLDLRESPRRAEIAMGVHIKKYGPHPNFVYSRL